MSEASFLIHVDESQDCLHAKALLEHCNASYTVTTEACDEWPSLPAVYCITKNDKELIGGYAQLCDFVEGQL